MKKTLLIIKREYLSRVRKNSFVLMTFLVPGLIIGMYALIIALSINGSDSITKVNVIDESNIFRNELKDSKSINFIAIDANLATAKALIKKEEDVFVLYIPKDITAGHSAQLYSQKKAGLNIVTDLENQMKDVLKSKMMLEAGINPKILESIKPDIEIVSKEVTEHGEKESSAGAAFGIGIAAAVLIYMSMFIYGAQVMRGVIEEKTSRIIEVVISSVKPFQLMLGKIIGIGLVGLTQFLLWIALSTTLLTVGGKILMKDKIDQIKTEAKQSINTPNQNPQVPNSPAFQAMKAIQTIPFGFILTIFITYFLGGYMLYSALFAAVGSAVDSETETQQFMFPLTLPLLFTYIMSFSFIVNNPDSSLSFWLSMIPFTSPIAMMVRVPFGVPEWQLALSIVLLIAGFIFTTWIASRIYRVGILMYGKKSSFKELIKWFSYKE